MDEDNFAYMLYDHSTHLLGIYDKFRNAISKIPIAENEELTSLYKVNDFLIAQRSSNTLFSFDIKDNKLVKTGTKIEVNIRKGEFGEHLIKQNKNNFYFLDEKKFNKIEVNEDTREFK